LSPTVKENMGVPGGDPNSADMTISVGDIRERRAGKVARDLDTVKQAATGESKPHQNDHS
jgi:hypothetical protein